MQYIDYSESHCTTVQFSSVPDSLISGSSIASWNGPRASPGPGIEYVGYDRVIGYYSLVTDDIDKVAK